MKYVLMIALLPNYFLLQAGRDTESIKSGWPNAIVQQEADDHAQWMARVQRQSHVGFSQRVFRLAKQMPGFRFQEVVAESWPDQNAQDAAREIFRSWRLSQDHWSAVNGKCDYYGYAMARGEDGVWYACGILATRN